MPDLPARPPIDASVLRERLVDGGWWTSVSVSSSTGSTNADAAEAARAGAPEGTVVTTEEQVAGRGRLDRTWQTVPGAALAVSVVLRPTAPVASWVWLPLLTGLAVDAAVRRCGAPATLKWPNDVLIEDRKVAGILLERVDTPQGPAAVIGIGLNVTLGALELPVPTATSMWLAGASVTDRTEVLAIVLEELQQQYGTWTALDGAPSGALRDRYVARCGTVGRTVRVLLPDGSELVGRAETVDEHGRLVVDRTPVSAGDVTHVRPV